MKCWQVLAILLPFAACSPTQDEAPDSLVQVRVSTVKQAQIEHKVEAPATLFPAEEATISSRLTAPINRLEVGKGDAVRKDQILLALDARDLEAQRVEAAIAVADAEANLTRLLKGTLPGDLERARGQVEASRALLSQARDTYDRRNRLFSDGAIPRKDLLASETVLRQVEVDYQNATRALDLLENQTSDQDIKIASLRRDQQKARLDLINTQIDFSQIRSPFSGFITEQFVYPGDMAQPGTPLLKVSDLSRLVARAQVPDSSSGALTVGQPCSFRSADFPDQVLTGLVSVVNRTVDPIRRTVEVWCEISGHPGTARVGSYGQTTFLLGVETGLTVPRSAVQFMEGSSNGIAMVVDSGEIAHSRDVETGTLFDDQVEVLKGLAAGETVIVEGGYGLPDGARVQQMKAGSP
jgi:multidrug efflux pump subunit AcrA (membrane-fusion protein)